MTRLLLVSSSRADVGILSPVWNHLAHSAKTEVHVLLTGMHMKDDTFARSHLPSGVTVHKRGVDLMGTDAVTAARNMGRIAQDCAELYDSIAPDLILLIGDRMDMFPAAMASTPFNIPLAHLHGGEVTLGAIDERLRHAITKMAHIHFAATADSAHRICRMGEEPWRIHVTGAPGLDTLRSVERMERLALMQALGLEGYANAPLRLVGMHPETNCPQPLAPMEAILAALGELPELPTLFTAPNSDPGGAAMRAEIESFVSSRPWAVFHDTLGSTLYANAFRHGAVLIGNTSSGIIEAPLFALPFLNVGNRQEGRLQSDTAANCPNDKDRIKAAISRLLSLPRMDFEQGSSPYGDGRSARRIAQVLESLPSREKLTHKGFWSEDGAFTNPWEPS